MINKFIITIDPNYEKALNTYGSITYKSKLIKGLYVMTTLFEKEKLEQLSFVKRVEENTTGNLYI